MWNNIRWFIGGIWAMVVTIPTVIALGRGFTLTLGQGTRGFGAVMDDTISLIMFWTFTILVGGGFIWLIAVTVYRKITGKRIRQDSRAEYSKAISESGSQHQTITDSDSKIAAVVIVIIGLAMIFAYKKKGAINETTRKIARGK